jgi:cytoskeletal protein RodZ
MDSEDSVDSTTTNTDRVSIPPAKKSNKVLYVILGLVAFFVVIPGILLTIGGVFLNSKFGSEKAAEKTIESLVERSSGGKVDVSTKDGAINITSKDGGDSINIGSNQKLAADFPKDKIPFIAEKSVVFALNSTNDGKKSWSVTTTVNASVEEAKNFFESKIKEPEYTSTSSSGSADSQFITGKSADYDIVIVIAKTKDSPDTQVSYTVVQN